VASFDANVDVTVEAAFGDGPFTASPTWENISTFPAGGEWSRGKQSITVHDIFPAGQGQLVLDNSDGRFYPWNTSSPYSPDVTVGVPIRIRATHNAVTYPLFYGYAERWDTPFPTNTDELVYVDIIETISRLEGKRLSGAFAAGSTDERVADILDAAGWPAGLRDLDIGVADVAAVTVEDVSALDMLRVAATIEQGLIYQARDGDLTFKNRVHAGGVTSAATFGPDGAELTYTNVSVPTADDLFFNEAMITGADGIEVTATDATSKTIHGPVTFSYQDDSIVGQGSAMNIAEWIVAKYKTVDQYIDGFTIDPAGDPANLWPEVLGRELHDLVTVEASFPGSPIQLVSEIAVEYVKHAFTAGDVWHVAYQGHPLSTLEQDLFWILGTSQLGSTTVLA
jgi:hypothetical protein